MRGDRIRDREEVSDKDINFDDIPEMTDFPTDVRGRFYMRMSVHRVSVANDLIDVFPEDEDLNAALRVLIEEGRTPENIPPRRFAPEWIQRYNLDDDVANHFHSDESINAALRLLIDEGRVPKRKKKK